MFLFCFFFSLSLSFYHVVLYQFALNLYFSYSVIHKVQWFIKMGKMLEYVIQIQKNLAEKNTTKTGGTPKYNM